MVKLNLVVLLGTSPRLLRLVSRLDFLKRKRALLEDIRAVEEDIDRAKKDLGEVFAAEYERHLRDTLRIMEREYVDWDVIRSVKAAWVKASPEERRARAFAFKGVDLSVPWEPRTARDFFELVDRITNTAARMARARDNEAVRCYFYRTWDDIIYDPAGAQSPELTEEEVEELRELYRKRREVGLVEEEYKRLRELELKGARGPRVYVPKLPR